MKKTLSLLAVVLLVGCTAPQTPEQAVYLAQSDYAAALRVELAYSNLPRCGKPDSPKLCSDADIIRQLQKADDLAWIAIQEAQAAVRSPTFTEGKVGITVATARALTNAFIKITDKLGVK